MTITAEITLESGDICRVQAEVMGGDFDSVEPIGNNLTLSRIEQWDAEDAIRSEIEDRLQRH